MKRKISTLLAITLLISSLIGCEKTEDITPSTPVTPEIASQTTPEVSTPLNDEISNEPNFDIALNIYNQVSKSTLDLDFEQSATIDDKMYFKVKDYTSIQEVKSYLSTIFSPEIVEEFVLLEQLYIEHDGDLYSTPSDAPTNASIGDIISQDVNFIDDNNCIITVEVETKNENYEVDGSKNIEFVCEKLNDNWIFKTFPGIN